MKKLVPAMRSSSNKIPPPNSTGNESNASTAVVNQAQQVSGMRMSDMPRVRMLISVVMKFRAPSSEPTQKIPAAGLPDVPLRLPGRRQHARGAVIPWAR